MSFQTVVLLVVMLQRWTGFFKVNISFHKTSSGLAFIFSEKNILTIHWPPGTYMTSFTVQEAVYWLKYSRGVRAPPAWRNCHHQDGPRSSACSPFFETARTERRQQRMREKFHPMTYCACVELAYPQLSMLKKLYRGVSMRDGHRQ